MADAIRFFADQHYPGPVVQGLRRRGIDVLTAQEAGRCEIADPEQLSFAQNEGRVMLTFDSDFVALHRSGASHAGIAWCPATKYSIGEPGFATASRRLTTQQGTTFFKLWTR